MIRFRLVKTIWPYPSKYDTIAVVIVLIVTVTTMILNLIVFVALDNVTQDFDQGVLLLFYSSFVLLIDAILSILFLRAIKKTKSDLNALLKQPSGNSIIIQKSSINNTHVSSSPGSSSKTNVHKNMNNNRYVTILERVLRVMLLLAWLPFILFMVNVSVHTDSETLITEIGGLIVPVHSYACLRYVELVRLIMNPPTSNYPTKITKTSSNDVISSSKHVFQEMDSTHELMEKSSIP